MSESPDMTNTTIQLDSIMQKKPAMFVASLAKD